MSVLLFKLLTSPAPREFLMLCMRFLGAIRNTGRGSYANEAEQLTGKVLERLRYDHIDEILRGGLHGYLSEIGMFNIIGQSIAQTYFYYRSISGELRANGAQSRLRPLHLAVGFLPVSRALSGRGRERGRRPHTRSPKGDERRCGERVYVLPSR